MSMFSIASAKSDVRFGNGRFERIKIDHHHVDGLEATFARFGLVFLVATFVEKTPMHTGMQSFHAPFQHFWKRSETRNVANWNLFLPQQICRSSGRNDVHSLPLQRSGKRSDTGLVGNRNESASNLQNS